MKLIIENIRSFAGHHELNIRPLTLLVGENSSGKSTFLAALGAVSDSDLFPNATALNKAPYDLGTFDTTATYKGGKAGRAKSFSLGYTVPPREKNGQDVEVLATYYSEDGETRLKTLQFTEGAVKAKMTWEKEQISTRITGLKKTDSVEITIDGAMPLFPAAPFSTLVEFLSTSIFKPGDKVDRNELFKFYEEFRAYTERWRFSAPHSTSIAPIRSEPKRIYDRLSDEYNPGGDHVPFVLAGIFQKENTKKGTSLIEAVETFGQQAGLFRHLNIKRLGTKAGDPFKMQVTVGGPAVNLSDVGYGVNQSLPIIVESLLRLSGSRILLQQPEVHLHPRAQAALGTFFAKLVSDGGREFVIETHSDYLIDRVRQEVAAGRLKAESVAIMFFSRPHIETKVDQLTLDEEGNIRNAPENYRAFFLEEELRLLTRATGN